MRTPAPATSRDPATLLFRTTRRRVLGWLLGHADDAFYLRELQGLFAKTGGADEVR